MVRLRERITENFHDMALWGRNAKVLVATELVWGIPMSWVFFYQIIFMRNLGMSEVLIGFTAMLPLLLQIFLPILGGYLADEFGRKQTLMIVDCIAWLGAMTMWFIATEPWHIITAVVFQGLSTTIYGVWETLLVEDTASPYRVSIYSSIQVIYIIGGILTPIAGALISFYGVDQGCRYLFFIALILIAVSFLLRQIYLKEFKIESMPSSPHRESQSGYGGYKETLKTVIQHKKLLILFTSTIIGSMLYPLLGTYKPLYLTDPKALALNESTVSIIPTASSIPSLIILSLIVPKVKYTHVKKALLFSYTCGILSFITLITAPKGSLVLAAFSAILDSARFIAIFSILRVYCINTIDEVNPLAKGKILSLLTTFTALASWPVPLVGGYLYAANPAYPFILAASFLVLSMFLIIKI